MTNGIPLKSSSLISISRYFTCTVTQEFFIIVCDSKHFSRSLKQETKTLNQQAKFICQTSSVELNANGVSAAPGTTTEPGGCTSGGGSCKHQIFSNLHAGSVNFMQMQEKQIKNL